MCRKSRIRVMSARTLCVRLLRRQLFESKFHRWRMHEVTPTAADVESYLGCNSGQAIVQRAKS